MKAEQQVWRAVVRQSPRPLSEAERQARRLAIRRSDRNAGKPAPDYRVQTGNGYAVEYVPRSRTSRINRSGSYSRAVLDSNSGWNPSKGLASSAAAAAANDAAEALIDQIEAEGGHAYAKIMTSSQVSSGFWANAPRGVEQHITFLEKTSISLRLPKDVEDPADALYQRDDGSWHCVWLPRKTGAGFSGGWRGFAIDLDRFPGDVCVFEIDETSRRSIGDSVDVLIVHICRAFEYDSESVREQRKQAAAEDEEDELAEEDEEEALAAELENEESENEEDEDDEEEVIPVRKTRGASSTLKNPSSSIDVAATTEESDEEEDEAPVVITTNTRETRKTRTRNTTTQIVTTKRKRHVEIIEDEEEEEIEEEVQKLTRATVNRRKQKSTPRTLTAVNQKGSKRTSKKQKKNSPTPPVEIEGEESELDATEDDNEDGTGEEVVEYFVEKIMDVRTESDGTKMYFIKWYGYPHSQNTWEPVEMLNASPEKYPRAPNLVL